MCEVSVLSFREVEFDHRGSRDSRRVDFFFFKAAVRHTKRVTQRQDPMSGNGTNQIVLIISVKILKVDQRETLIIQTKSWQQVVITHDFYSANMFGCGDSRSSLRKPPMERHVTSG